MSSPAARARARLREDTIARLRAFLADHPPPDGTERVILFGSLARGDFHPWSDADIAVLDAREDWAEAERAAHEAAEAFGVEADVSFWEELFGRVRAEALRDGVACG